MKKLIYPIVIVLLVMIAFLGCRQNDNIDAGTGLIEEADTSSELDKYIEEKIVKPYNIEVVYKYRESLLKLDRYHYPTDPTKVKKLVDVLLKIWVEPYTKLGGDDFVKRIAPRQIVFVGSKSRDPNGSTRTLGFADSGKRIVLFEANLIDAGKLGDVNGFFRTLQHEYIHIINQTVPFDVTAFEEVTPGLYQSNWSNITTTQAHINGFVSPYSRANVIEDFAETCSFMLTRSKAEWDAFVTAIGTIVSTEYSPYTRTVAVSKIREKEALVVKYFQENFGIDFYQLQEEIYNATQKIVAENAQN